MWNSIKEMTNVHFENILTVLRVCSDPLLDDLFSFVSSPTGQTRIGVLIHALAKHRLKSVDNIMLHDQLFHSRNDDDTLFATDSVININRRMLGVFVIDYSVIGFFNHGFVRHIPVFHYSTDSLAVLCKF